MRLWIKSACVAFVLTVLYSLIPFQAACTDISGEVFRLHILANSDSDADQALKLKVRDSVLACSEALFAQAKSKEEAESRGICRSWRRSPPPPCAKTAMLIPYARR